jgi:hypothetical protein
LSENIYPPGEYDKNGQKGPGADQAARVQRRERYSPRSAERLPESREHHEVSVKLHLRRSAHPKRRESVVMLQAAELALDGFTATVEIAEPLCVPRDHRGYAAPVRADWKHEPTAPDLHVYDPFVTATVALGLRPPGAPSDAVSIIDNR